jgi:DNA-binding response OmpR family regulator
MTREAAELVLVEDDPHDVELTLRALRLEDIPFNVQVLRDGEEALDYLYRRGEWSNRPTDHVPSLILMDLKLPKIDGLQVLRDVKANAELSAIPIVVLTSSGEHRDVTESYRLGANSYVQKPVNISEFRSTMKAIVTYWLTVAKLPSGALLPVHRTSEAPSHG